MCLVAFHTPCYLWWVQMQFFQEGPGAFAPSGLESERLRISLGYTQPPPFDRQYKLKDLVRPRNWGPKLGPWVFINS